MDKKNLLKVLDRKIKRIWYHYLVLVTKNDIKCKLPKDINLRHSGIGVITTERVRFGKNCTLSANSNIGTPRKYNTGKNWVIIGDNVDIGIKVSIMNLSYEDLFIGDNVIIYPGAMVFKSVPKNTVVKGVWK